MNYFACRRRPDLCAPPPIFLGIQTRRIQLRTATRRQPARIDHAVLHGVFYMHISLPFPRAGALGRYARVTLRRSRRPGHSSSKILSSALLGERCSRRASPDPGQYPFFILPFSRHPRPSYFAGYVRRSKANSNYIRDTGIPPRVLSRGPGN